MREDPELDNCPLRVVFLSPQFVILRHRAYLPDPA